MWAFKQSARNGCQLGWFRIRTFHIAPSTFDLHASSSQWKTDFNTICTYHMYSTHITHVYAYIYLYIFSNEIYQCIHKMKQCNLLLWTDVRAIQCAIQLFAVEYTDTSSSNLNFSTTEPLWIFQACNLSAIHYSYPSLHPFLGKYTSFF